MPLRVADIYCGAGGLSAGFASARLRLPDGTEESFEIVYGVDRDADCMRSYQENHFSHLPPEDRPRVGLTSKVEEVTGQGIRDAAGVGTIDVVVGGPNCQGVSAAGLRNPDDKRNRMFHHFHRLVKELEPTWFVMENVPGLAHVNNRALLEEIFNLFAEIGYKVTADALLAADFGVAQLRYRLFLIGNRHGAAGHRTHAPIRFPAPTHQPPRPQLGLEALGELPFYKKVSDRIKDLEKYVPVEGGKEEPDDGRPRNHVVYATRKENLARIAQVGQGQDWRAIPIRLLPDRNLATRASDQVGAYGRLSWDYPAYTITAAAGNVTAGMFTHPTRRGPISAREAARLQGFGDEYVFHGAVDSVYRQVGNAVPPPLAQAVGEAVLRCHFLPAEAARWGRDGRITAAVLRATKHGKLFPVLTPRHAMRAPRPKGAPAPKGTAKKAEQPPGKFEADPTRRKPAPLPDLKRLRVEARQPRNVRAARRAQVIGAYFEKAPVEKLVEIADKPRATVEAWVNDFYRGGVEGWRAYHTPVGRLAGDDAKLRRRLERAVEQARMRMLRRPNGAGKASSPSPGARRAYMNAYLRRLVTLFGSRSTNDLLELARKRLGTGVGTMYVGDLLAVCGVVASPSVQSRKGTRGTASSPVPKSRKRQRTPPNGGRNGAAKESPRVTPYPSRAGSKSGGPGRGSTGRAAISADHAAG